MYRVQDDIFFLKLYALYILEEFEYKGSPTPFMWVDSLHKTFMM